MSIREDMTLGEMYGINENTPDEVVNKTLTYIFKTELIHIVDKEGLLQIYNTKEKYNQFLGMVSSLIQTEPEFLSFLTSATDDILYIINYGMRNYDIDNEGKRLGNELTYYLNILKNNSTDEFRYQYAIAQSEARVCKFKTEKELLRSIAYDSIAIGLLHMNETDSVNEKLFLASTCYMLDDFRELYQSDSSYIDKSLDIMKHIRKKSNIGTKIKVKSIEKALKNFNKNN